MSGRSEQIDSVDDAGAGRAHAPFIDRREGDRHAAVALKLLSQQPEGTSPKRLPVLATAGDIREVVQFLKKKPAGITVVEAMDTVKKRVFEPRKVTAYEFWGIITRDGDRLKLSSLGWEFARRQEPETHVYRFVLNRLEPYRSVLEWMRLEEMELVTHLDVAAFWQEHYTEAIELHNDKSIEGSVVCFFHLCQAAELGTVTIGKRGQPARLRIERDELQSHLEAHFETMPATLPDESSAQPNREFEGNSAVPVASTLTVSRQTSKASAQSINGLRMFISCRSHLESIDQIKLTLELADVTCHIAHRNQDEKIPMSAEIFHAMRRCDAGIVVIARDDFRKDTDGAYLKEDVLAEISAAYVHFDRRIVLLWEKGFSIPANLPPMHLCEFEDESLSWAAAVDLMKTVKDFKNR